MFFRMVYKSRPIFLPFRTIYACDRRTEGRTDRILITIPRLHYMQRGKNRLAFRRVTGRNKVAPFFPDMVYIYMVYIYNSNRKCLKTLCESVLDRRYILQWQQHIVLSTIFTNDTSFDHPLSRVAYNFGRVCLPVCLSVCLSVRR